MKKIQSYGYALALLMQGLVINGAAAPAYQPREALVFEEWLGTPGNVAQELPREFQEEQYGQYVQGFKQQYAIVEQEDQKFAQEDAPPSYEGIIRNRLAGIGDSLEDLLEQGKRLVSSQVAIPEAVESVRAQLSQELDRIRAAISDKVDTKANYERQRKVTTVLSDLTDKAKEWAKGVRSHVPQLVRAPQLVLVHPHPRPAIMPEPAVAPEVLESQVRQLRSQIDEENRAIITHDRVRDWPKIRRLQAEADALEAQLAARRAVAPAPRPVFAPAVRPAVGPMPARAPLAETPESLEARAKQLESEAIDIEARAGHPMNVGRQDGDRIESLDAQAKALRARAQELRRARG